MPIKLEESCDISAAQTAPNEVLLKIFESLELMDRLAVRLVCRKWYDVCRDRRFHMNEKFTIEELYRKCVPDVLEFFTSVDREYFNFEFNGLTFGDDSTDFWEICGPKIYSLVFIECELSVETFRHIVTDCTSLQKLTLSLCENVGELGDETRELDLATIINSGNVNTNVRSVELRFRGVKHQWTRWFVQFFRLFPGIQRFAFYGSEYMYDYEIMGPAQLAAINETVFSPRIEELRLVTYQYQYREIDWTVLATKEQLAMLTEVAVHVNDSTNKELLASFLGRQRNLEILHFLLRTSLRTAVMDDSFDIIFEQCPKLNDLRLTAMRRLSWRLRWFHLLAKSSVESLKIECDDIVFPEIKVYPANSTMRRLEIQFKSFFNSSTLPLIEAFSFVEELIIFKITDKIMSAVLKQLKHLKLLNARFKARLVSRVMHESFETVHDRQFLSDFSSLCLERLSIPADLPKCANFLTPRLKYLHLHPPMGEVFYNPISLDTESSPFLEEVIIETSCFSYPFRGTFTDNIFRFTRPLKRLRYFYITSRTRLVYSSDMPYLADDFIKILFERCPSLRCFVYKRIYFRNNLDRKCLTIADMDDHFTRTSTRVYKCLHLPPVQSSLEL